LSEASDAVSIRVQSPRRKVETPIVGIVTRFRFAHVWDVARSYFAFRRIRDAARGTPGYLNSVFLIEDLHTCYSLSIWEHAASIPVFGTTVTEHVRAGNWAFARLRRTTRGERELWSTQWRLDTVSNNLAWEGFELNDHLPIGVSVSVGSTT
jgi:hypothetical protein